MRLRTPLAIAATLAVSLPAATAVVSATAAAPMTRTVYVTVTDAKGVPVTDLTAADVVVKEGGKEREVVKVEPAAQRMRLALAVEERLLTAGSVRLALFEFVKRVADKAEISLISIALANRTLVDYSADPNPVLNAINTMTINPGSDSNVAEGVLDLSEKFQAQKAQRPVMVIVALSGGGQSSANPRNVLDRLADSGATMHSVTLLGGGGAASLGTLNEESGREQVLGDGPKQSGGRRIDVSTVNAMPKALEQVADDLLAQYAVSYVLPDGTKPNKRFNISTKKRGVTLRAPSLIPDR